MSALLYGYVALTCARCDVTFYLPGDLHSAARRDPSISFYCPHGHSQHFPAGESNEEKLRRERDALKQRLARKDDEISSQRKRAETAERSAAAYKGQTTKLRKRAAAGVCPCCNRSFQNLARHMQSKHPEFAEQREELG